MFSPELPIRIEVSPGTMNLKKKTLTSSGLKDPRMPDQYHKVA